MKYYNKNKIYITLGLICAIFIIACSKMDDPIKQYTKSGEMIYSTRIDSLKAFPGNQRIKLTWLLPANHSATRAVVYWDGKLQSKELSLVRTANNNYETTLVNMPEVSYLFSVYTYDKNGNPSVKCEVGSVAYGERYRQGLLNRVYIKLSKVSEALLINWSLAEKSQKAIEVEYTSSSGEKISLVTVPNNNTTTIANINFTLPIRYRTIYNPELKSIDDFASDWTNSININKL